MYSTCLFCHASLGGNEVLERFLVGRRLAFDGAKGRLWVVCPRCARWNLTPLEERWEAIEECERQFRGTRTRASTGQIGFAKLPEGLELVRIGQPLRPEFAAWRYGTRLVARRRRDIAGGVLVGVGGTVGVLGAAIGALVVSPILFAAPPLAFAAGAVTIARWQMRRVVARVRDAAGGTALVRAEHLPALRIGEPAGGLTARVVTQTDAGHVEVAGADAERLMILACVRRTQIGATSDAVRDALVRVEQLGGPAGVLRHASGAGTLARVRYLERLGLEMALHEEAERRALEGELAELEAAWREAEAIAAIVDDMFLPESVTDFIAKHRER